MKKTFEMPHFQKDDNYNASYREPIFLCTEVTRMCEIVSTQLAISDHLCHLVDNPNPFFVLLQPFLKINHMLQQGL